MSSMSVKSRALKAPCRDAALPGLVGGAPRSPVRIVQLAVPAERVLEIQALAAAWMAEWSRRRKVETERAAARALAEAQGALPFDPAAAEAPPADVPPARAPERRPAAEPPSGGDFRLI